MWRGGARSQMEAWELDGCACFLVFDTIEEAENDENLSAF